MLVPENRFLSGTAATKVVPGDGGITKPWSLAMEGPQVVVPVDGRRDHKIVIPTINEDDKELTEFNNTYAPDGLPHSV
jgi:hypothetical protein